MCKQVLSMLPAIPPAKDREEHAAAALVAAWRHVRECASCRRLVTESVSPANEIDYLLRDECDPLRHQLYAEKLHQRGVGTDLSSVTLRTLAWLNTTPHGLKRVS